jgi:hypothetical protein
MMPVLPVSLVGAWSIRVGKVKSWEVMEDIPGPAVSNQPSSRPRLGSGMLLPVRHKETVAGGWKHVPMYQTDGHTVRRTCDGP